MTNEIHPAPQQFSTAQLEADPILHFFHFTHLPPQLQASSKPFCDLANHIVTTLPRNAERTVALRKLLEAKDAGVRANARLDDLRTREPAPPSDEPIVIEQNTFDIDRDGLPE